MRASGPLAIFLALRRFFLVFRAVVLAALLDRVAADFFPIFPADLPAAFFAAVFLLAFFAVRFGAVRFLLRAGATAIGGIIMGSETRPSAASGM
jgi:hypothetical protein